MKRQRNNNNNVSNNINEPSTSKSHNSSIDFFRALNNISSTSNYPIKRLNDLTVEQSYIVTNLRKTKTMYGDKYLIICNNEFSIYLPSKISTFFDRNHDEYEKFMENLKTQKCRIKYLGNYAFYFYNED